jgi:dUTP pyrophosphatase
MLPRRATRYSAGYDFFLPYDVVLNSGEKITIATGVRCNLPFDKFLAIVPKSGLGTKHSLVLANTIGIIDSDYYGADNYGHILVTLFNQGKNTVQLQKNQSFVQGIVMKYFTLEEEEVNQKRKGGHGSTSL